MIIKNRILNLAAIFILIGGLPNTALAETMLDCVNRSFESLFKTIDDTVKLRAPSQLDGAVRAVSLMCQKQELKDADPLVRKAFESDIYEAALRRYGTHNTVVAAWARTNKVVRLPAPAASHRAAPRTR